MTIQHDERINGAAVTPAKHVVDLATVHRDHRAALGGKAARLADLLQAGFPVPDAFAIDAAAFRDFVRATGLEATIAAEGDTPSLEACARIRDAIVAAAMPDALARDIVTAYERLGRTRVAVRSSAIGEDSASHSFAGQHDTFLDVAGDDAVLVAVKRCWASLWSDRARAYRASSSAGGRREIAVVVQKMVHADAAGVVFTTDPVGGQPDRLVIEACWGLGEGLVAGRVTTDSFVVDGKLAIVDKQIRYKLTMCAPTAPGEVGIVKVSPEKRDAPALSNDAVRELARLAILIRDHYGSEQDIEWATRGATIHLLQARPITTQPKKTHAVTPYARSYGDDVMTNTLWSRMDIGEIFTGILSPLGVTFARYYQYNVHGDCGRALGLRDTADDGATMGYLHGHVYLNVSYTAWILSQAPPTRDQSEFTTRFTSEEVDLASYVNPFGVYPPGVRRMKSSVVWMRYAVRELATMKKRAGRLVAQRFEQYDRFRAIDLTKMSRGALSQELDRALRYFHDAHVGYMPYYINAFGFYGIIAKLCAKWMDGDGQNLQNRIKADMSNLRTVQSAREVWELSQRARESARVIEIIEGTPLEDIPAALQADPAGTKFWTSHVEPFMRVNGTRGREEMELTNPRWIDDPSYVFQMIRKYVEEGFSVDDALARGRLRRTEGSDDVLAKLPRARREVLRLLIKLYSTCSEMREQVRLSMTTSIWLVRRIVYEVGRRLVEEGALRSLDEVAYIDFENVRRWLAGESSSGEAFARRGIDEARARHQYYLRLPAPPLTFIGSYDPTKAAPATGADEAGALRGLGTSPGRVVGRARLIHDLVRQADELEPGEILVTPFTDASWTPLFAIAGGVVTDIGSMLSHSSIVSREFNIPSVVNTKTATKSIRTGDTLLVDGDLGVVQVVS